jgi:signal transduction protein with GAF and PtsI domain
MDHLEGEVCRLCGDLAKEAPDLNATLKVLAQNITKIMGVKGCTIRLLDEKNQTLEIAASFGLSTGYLQKGPVALKEHPVDRKILRGGVVSTKDITKEPHVLYLKEAKKEGIKSVLSVPLVSGERHIGVIRIYTSEPHIFTKEEISRLKALSSLGGIIAGRAKIWDEMNALVRISRSITSSLSLDEVLRMVVESAANILGVKAASLRLLDEERKTLKVKAAYGLSKSYLDKGSVEVEKSVIDRECLGCKVINVKDIRKDKRLQYPGELIKEGIAALLSLPLTVRGSAIGVLRVYTSVPYTFSESEVDFVSALACQGAIAIENARLFEHVRSEYKDLARDVWKWYDWGERFPTL